MVSYFSTPSSFNGCCSVLILVVMEDGLVHLLIEMIILKLLSVLILVVMEDGLVRSTPCYFCSYSRSLNPCCNGRWSRTNYSCNNSLFSSCLNPCCNGRWSRTRPYKTILIISKLKNFAKQILTFLNRKLTIP